MYPLCTKCQHNLVNLNNATAIGANAVVDANDKIRLGDVNVTVVETDGDFHSTGGGFISGSTTTFGDGSITLSAGTNLNVDSDTLFVDNANDRVGLGTTTPGEQLEITGNFELPATTATDGIIMSNGSRFIHNFGPGNFFAGVNAGNLTMTGSGNTGVGGDTLLFNTTGSYNTAVGDNALLSNGVGFSNTAVGDDALLFNTLGGENTAVGEAALVSNTTGDDNTAVGQVALELNTTGSDNTGIGWGALDSNTTGDNNTALGNRANVSTGNLTNATAIGAGAIVDASNKIRLGDANVTVVETDGDFETTGNLRLPTTTATDGIIMSNGSRFIHNYGTDNFFAGVNAGNLTMTSSGNTGVGVNALQSNTSGFDNTAVGKGALDSNTTGSFNTAVGNDALILNTIGFDNTAVGEGALDSNTTGLFNTAVGDDALDSNTIGIENTAIGWHALNNNTTGSKNTALGDSANVSVGNLTNATAIGASATVDASNKIRLGNTNVTVIEGTVAYTFPSDFNMKENFLAVDGEQVLEKIRDFNLQSWNYKGHDPSQFRHYGPTAQEFYAAFGKDDIGTIGTDTTINGGDMDGILMTAIQALEERTANLEILIARNEELTLHMLEQERKIERLEAQVGTQGSIAESVSSSDNNVVVLAGGMAGVLIVLSIMVGWYVRRQSRVKQV